MTVLKSPFGHVGHTRPAHVAGGEDVLGVLVARRLDAVRGEQDRAGKLAELLALVLPRGAVVPVEVRVLLELGIAVRGQHLAVRVDVDALALRLLEQHLAGRAGRGR